MIAVVSSIAPLWAAPPDLTAAGVIAGIDRSDTYNLGATGLRGWIYVDRNNVGDVGKMTDQSRQILVTTASAPGNAVLQMDDVILGAMAGGTGAVPYFTTDCRKALGAAIGDAEKTGGGVLRVRRWRNGVESDESITIPILGNYASTAPYSCPKSTQILANARNQMVGELLANANYLDNGYSGATHALALLASVKPTDPNYAAVQTRLQTHARSLASNGPINGGLPIWDWAYKLIFLSEYYLITGDSQVVDGIENFTLTLAQSQSIYGSFGHGPAALKPDGSGRRIATGYGPVNAVGAAANLSIVLGKKALVAAGRSVHTDIDTAITRGSNFFGWYVNKGSLPYGEHEPWVAGHASNGKDPTAALFFGLQANRATETEYFSRMAIAHWIGRESGHTGQGLSYLWTALGANMAGSLGASEHLKPVLWHLDLARRSDGSFTYDGQEQYGGGTTSDGSYLGRSHHYEQNPTAIYLLTYSLPLQRLYITGKKDASVTDYSLDSTKIANAVAAGSYPLDRTSKTKAQLITALNEYDPVVRYFAAVELGSRSLTTGELNTLRGMLGSTNANERQGACQVLGIKQDATALPTIVGLLSDTDLWVRAKAAIAIRSYTAAAASAHLTTMLNAFIANATDPDVIDWSDPLQVSNRHLSLVLFGNGVPDGTPGSNVASYTINASKSLLYAALKVGLKQPDSYPRTGVAMFCRQRLPLADLQALFPDMVEVVSSECQADRMWSASPRAEGIQLMANYKITEGIPLALAMLEVPENFEWGSGEYLTAALNALAVYGDAARYTLPTLRGYLNTWNPGNAEYAVLVSTISTIENAITSPAQQPGNCVANSQVVTTSGAKAITLSGASPRGSFSYINVTQPAHGTVTGTAPNLTYTPTPGYTGPDQFTFQTTDTLTTSAVATVGIVVGSAGNGLKGDYYNNADFTAFALTRTDPQVNFDWGTGSPHASIVADTFSVRWTGAMLVPRSGAYTFSTLSSDGVRLYVNGQLVIDRFSDQSTLWRDGEPVYLSAGQLADVYLEYYENTGSAVAKLKWTGPGFAGLNGAIVPQAYLFDGSSLSSRPAYAFTQNLTTNKNTALPITLNGSGGSLSYIILTQPTNGTLSGTAPNLTYTPTSNFSGTDSFTFIVNNGTRNSLPATVSISVLAGALTQYNWSTATTGNWSAAARWTPGLPAAAGQANYALNFNASGTYTATHDLNNGFQLNQLNLNSNVTLAGTSALAFVANGGGQPSFNQNGGNPVMVSAPVTLSAATTFGGSGGGQVDLSGLISGAGSLIKSSPGALMLYGINPTNGTVVPNTYSGGTVVNGGTLMLGAMYNGISPDCINPAGTGPVTLNAGVIRFQRVTMSNALVVNGGTLHSSNGWGFKWSGPVSLNNTLTVLSDYSSTISGAISGAGGIRLTGGGLCTLTVANSYTGPTEVIEGTLRCSHVSALGSGALIVDEPGKINLNYTGTRGIASLALNGTVMPPGTYGSTTSSASHKNDTFFAGNGTITVLAPTTTALALTSGSTPADPGASLTFTATVTGSTPTGNVEFRAGTTLLGTAALNGSYQAAFTTNQLAVGAHSITARYVGNATNGASSSAVLEVEINNVPAGAPAAVSATPASPQINLSWDAVAGASGYYIKRSTTNGGPYVVIAQTSGVSYQNTNVQNSTIYHYVISAINSAGESIDSNQATAWIGPANTIDHWRYTYFTAAEILAGTAADGVDADGDGVFNRDEYVLGVDPRSSTTQPVAIANLNSSSFTVSFLARSAAGAGYSGWVRKYTLEGSDRLGAGAVWQAVSGYTNIVGASQSSNITGSGQTVTVTLPLNGSDRFFRLKALLE